MDLWIIATLAATVFQTLRFMLQKQLSMGALSTAGATFARFAYSAPLLAVVLAIYLQQTGIALPEVPIRFWIFGAIGGLAQIMATVFVVALFRARNFAVGITFKKTEVVQAALVGLIVLGEGVSALGLAAIMIGLVGVVLLSDVPDAQGNLMRRVFNRASGLGLGAGLLFAISGVCYRGASLDVAIDEPILRAAITLSAVTLMQFTAMTVWLYLREPGQIGAVWGARRKAVWIGLMSLGGSLGWFIAFTLQTAAYVKALGQVELLLSFLVSVLIFNEKLRPREGVAIGFLSVSILLLILVTTK